LRELAARGKLLPSDELARDPHGPWSAATRIGLFNEAAAADQPQAPLAARPDITRSQSELAPPQPVALADRIKSLHERATEVRRHRTRFIGRQLRANLALAYLAIATVLRGTLVPMLGWPWAVVLIGTAIVGAILVVTTPWPVALCFSAVVATILSTLMYFPSDSTVGKTGARLRDELAKLALQRSAARQEHLQVSTELAKAREQHDAIVAEEWAERRQKAMEEQQARPRRVEESYANVSVRCPKCGCTQLSANKRGMSGSDACCGALLLGPLGILCGLSGANQVIVTCLNCGYQWSRGKG
jgi:hypothetical protein